MPNRLTETLREALQQRGATLGTRWRDLEPDYVAEYGLTDEHCPALISLATEWVSKPSESNESYVAVHAWRALGQMRAVEAVQPLLDAQDKLDEIGDDWYLEEFHHVFGMIGEPAVDLLAAYLSDDSRGEFPRGKAASGLCEIVRRCPHTRDRVVGILTAELARHQQGVGYLNGSLVGDLIELDASESAEAIERAFAANVIDPVAVGDWGEVRRQLGVSGLGIAHDRSPGWPTIQERVGYPDPAVERRKAARARKKELAAKLKPRRKRKKNRKPR